MRARGKELAPRSMRDAGRGAEHGPRDAIEGTPDARATLRVLLVGGPVEFVEALHGVLERHWPGTELVHVHDGDRARAALETEPPDAICVRIDPPYGRAVSVLRRLRSLARSVPIVAVGPQRDVSFVDLVLRSGASLWLVDDPVDAAELAHALRPALTPAPRPSTDARRQRSASRAHLFAVDAPQFLAAPSETTSTGADDELAGPSTAVLSAETGIAPRSSANTTAESALARLPAPTAQVELSAEPAPASSSAVDHGAGDEPAGGAPLELVLARARKIVLVPIGPHGLPDVSAVARMRSLDVAADALRATFEGRTPLAGGNALVIGELDDARNEFAWVEHDPHASVADGTCVLRVRGTIEDLLDPARLEPVLDPATMRYRYGHAEELVAAWCALGVLIPVLVDRVLVCPRCQALPTIRLGCRQCGSARVECERLIHHFACANVARASEYETAHDLACPKCRARELVVNADYEYLSGPWDCRDCGYQCGERDPVCHCLVCAERFFSRDASELELVAYHAARMEPLALLAAP